MKKIFLPNNIFLNNIIWEDSLYHYIKEHNIKPSEKFIDFIFLIK